MFKLFRMGNFCKAVAGFYTILLFAACHYFASDYNKMLDGLLSKTVRLIDTDSLSLLLADSKTIHLMDCREPEEYNVSHLENAKAVGYKQFDLNKINLTKTDIIVVYCSVGYRSERIGEKLQMAGYRHVYNLYGGIFSWHNAGKKLIDNFGKVTKKIHIYNKNWGKWVKASEKIY